MSLTSGLFLTLQMALPLDHDGNLVGNEGDDKAPLPLNAVWVTSKTQYLSFQPGGAVNVMLTQQEKALGELISNLLEVIPRGRPIPKEEWNILTNSALEVYNQQLINEKEARIVPQIDIAKGTSTKPSTEDDDVNNYKGSGYYRDFLRRCALELWMGGSSVPFIPENAKPYLSSVFDGVPISTLKRC